MNIKKCLIITSAAVVLPSAFAPTVAQDGQARQIIKAADDKARGNTSYSHMTMTIKKRRINRTLEFYSWDNKEQEKFFIRIIGPKKDRGNTFLKIKKDLWQYVPKIGREIKIEGSLMQSSWMGSDFNNDDLVKQSSIVDDYTHSFDTSRSSNNHVIKLVPKPSAAVVWSKVIIEVDKSSGLFVKYEFYNHHNEMVKVMEFSNVKNLGGRMLPSVMTMTSFEDGQEQSHTTIVYKKVTFNLNIPGSTFSKANLRKR